MIPEWEQEDLFLSSLMLSNFSRAFERLTSLLEAKGIYYHLLPLTKDVWCRDYMPIQVDYDTFVQFKYSPDYLKNNPELRTDPVIINKHLGIDSKYSELVIDGGNIVNSSQVVIITDKVFKENSGLSRKAVREVLCQELDTEDVFFIPKQPYDYIGHSDGMVRFIDDYTILVNDFSGESISFRKRLIRALDKIPVRKFYIDVPFKHKFSWCYINFLQVGDLIIVPCIGVEKEIEIVRQFRCFFRDKEIHLIPSVEILKEGGGLRCISWQIKGYKC